MLINCIPSQSCLGCSGTSALDPCLGPERQRVRLVGSSERPLPHSRERGRNSARKPAHVRVTRVRPLQRIAHRTRHGEDRRCLAPLKSPIRRWRRLLLPRTTEHGEEGRTHSNCAHALPPPLHPPPPQRKKRKKKKSRAEPACGGGALLWGPQGGRIRANSSEFELWVPLVEGGHSGLSVMAVTGAPRGYWLRRLRRLRGCIMFVNCDIRFF